jgi:hypothetical protein
MGVLFDRGRESLPSQDHIVPIAPEEAAGAGSRGVSGGDFASNDLPAQGGTL